MTDVWRVFFGAKGSRATRAQVLYFFFENPNRHVFAAQLALLLHLPEATVRRTLKSLADLKILVSESARYRHWYYLDKRSPMIGKLKSLLTSESKTNIPASRIHGRYE